MFGDNTTPPPPPTEDTPEISPISGHRWERVEKWRWGFLKHYEERCRRCLEWRSNDPFEWPECSVICPGERPYPSLPLPSEGHVPEGRDLPVVPDV